MGFTFTPPVQQIGDNELWRPVSGALPDVIELNDTEGVEGINAPLPSDRQLRILLLDLGAVKGALHAYSDGNIDIQVGVVKSGGLGSGTISADDTATGESTNFTLIPDTISIQFNDGAIADLNTIDTTENERIRSNLVSGDLVQKRFTDIDDYIAVIPANDSTQQLKRVINADEWYLEFGGLNKRFAIQADGSILTNQFVAVVPAGAANGHIPIKNAAGVVIAKIPTVAP